MANTLSKLTTAGNLYTTGILDEATFNPNSGYTKNLATYSQTGSQWRISNSSPLAIIVSTTELAPDGTNTAVRVRPAVQYAGIQTPNACWISKTLITVSAWLRVDSGTRQIGFGSNGGAVAGSQNTVTSTWQRFSLTYTTSVSFNDFFVVYEPNTSGFVDYLVWGLQVEKGTTATIYEATGANAIPLANSLSKLDSSGNYYTKGTIDEVTFNPTQTGYRKNLFDYSNLNPTFWTFSNGTITQNTNIAPDGTNTATTLTGSTSTVPFFGSVELITQGVTYTFSIYAKAGTQSRVMMLLYGVNFNNNGANPSVTFDLSLGTVITTSGSPQSYGIQFVGNGWYRIYITGTATSSAADNSQIIRFQDGIYVSGNYAYVWGPQCEVGLSPTIYNPTNFGRPSSNNLSKLDTTGSHYLLGTYDEVTYNPNSGYIQNLISYSQNFENGVWGSPAYVITNATISPKGDNTGQKLYSTPAINGSSVQRISTFINFIAGKTYTYSVYAKLAEYSQFNLFSEQASRIGIRFNLSTNSFTVYGGSPTNTFINSVGNGWYRVGYTFIAPATETVLIDIQMINNAGVGTFIGDGSSGMYFWGAQLEKESGPTTYVATGAGGIPLGQ